MLEWVLTYYLYRGLQILAYGLKTANYALIAHGYCIVSTLTGPTTTQDKSPSSATPDTDVAGVGSNYDQTSHYQGKQTEVEHNECETPSSQVDSKSHTVPSKD